MVLQLPRWGRDAYAAAGSWREEERPLPSTTDRKGRGVAPFGPVYLLHKAGRTLQSDLGLTCGGNRCVHTRLLKQGKINIMNWDKRQVSFCSVEII